MTRPALVLTNEDRDMRGAFGWEIFGEKASLDGLRRWIYIQDQAPARCSVCSTALYPGAFVVFGDEDPFDLDDDFQRVNTCTLHRDAPVTWPAQVLLHFRVGSEEPLTLSVTQSTGSQAAEVSPAKLHPDTLPLLALALCRAHAWLDSTPSL